MRHSLSMCVCVCVNFVVVKKMILVDYNATDESGQKKPKSNHSFHFTLCVHRSRETMQIQ